MRRPAVAIAGTLILIAILIAYVIASAPKEGADSVSTDTIETQIEESLADRLAADELATPGVPPTVASVDCTRVTETEASCVAETEMTRSGERAEWRIEVLIDRDTGDFRYEAAPL